MIRSKELRDRLTIPLQIKQFRSPNTLLRYPKNKNWYLFVPVDMERTGSVAAMAQWAIIVAK